MTQLQALQEKFKQLKNETSTGPRFAFIKELLQENSPEMLEFHYSLLSQYNIDAELYGAVCRKFSERGEAGELYLLSRINEEEDPEVKATVLQILGTFKYKNGKHLEETAQLARGFLNASDAGLRRRALWVIGWVGNPGDIDQVGTLLFFDPESENKSWAATTLMQLYTTFPETRKQSSRLLQQALQAELTEHTLNAVLISLQEISSNNWDLDDANMEANTTKKLQSAKVKALKLDLA